MSYQKYGYFPTFNHGILLDGNVPVIEEIDRICDAPQKAHLAKYIEPFLAPSSPVRQHMQKWL